MKTRRHTRAAWTPTKDQIDAVVRFWGNSRSTWSYHPRVPISNVTFTDFNDRKYDEPFTDAKGGRRHVAELGALMKKRMPLPPAVGMLARNGQSIRLFDGNHRASAASDLRMKTIPIVVFDEIGQKAIRNPANGGLAANGAMTAALRQIVDTLSGAQSNPAGSKIRAVTKLRCEVCSRKPAASGEPRLCAECLGDESSSCQRHFAK